MSTAKGKNRSDFRGNQHVQVARHLAKLLQVSYEVYDGSLHDQQLQCGMPEAEEEMPVCPWCNKIGCAFSESTSQRVVNRACGEYEAFMTATLDDCSIVYREGEIKLKRQHGDGRVNCVHHLWRDTGELAWLPVFEVWMDCVVGSAS